MALMTLPRTPTLEPVKREFIAFLQDNIDQALAEVENRAAEAGYPAAALLAPVDYRQAVILDPVVILNYPTLTTTGWFLRSRVPHESRGSQQWTGSIDLTYFVQNTDEEELAISLDRYAEALWLVLINADEDHQLGRAELDYSSQQIEHSQPVGETMVTRAVRVSFDVTFTT